ncbi:MAG: serine/threonine protein kinase [Deltaproteobacteria bacterium]|nr:serine/threonine protein kinase [Deltaproteobacteria bacterium]
MSPAFKPTPFGRYYLTHLLARGGMAEVYTAKAFGAGDFEKTVVVKKILPQFADDERFITMLSDEARVTVQLTHTHIVQLLDFGTVNGQYYIAMEYIDGVDLKDVVTAAHQCGAAVPADVIGVVMSAVCRGLDHAHRKTGKDGAPLGIVHRDLSPHNVLLSFAGEVKVADFGIAKAASNVTKTQTGEIKGKVAYMSPEQAAGAALDARTDIFSAGLVLYELFTGVPLFEGDSQLEILGRIKATHVNPEMLPDTIPAPWRPIVAKALAHDTTDRYASAGEFERAIAELLQQAPVVTSTRLPEYLHTLFAGRIADRDRVLEPPIDPSVRLQLASFSGRVIAAAPEDVAAGTGTQALQSKSVSLRQAVMQSAKRFYLAVCVVNIILSVAADFLKPLFALAPTLLIISIALAGGIYLFSLRKYRRSNPFQRVLQSKIGEVFVFFAISAGIWATITVLSIFTPPRGVLAAKIKPVGKYQEQLLRIEEEIADIKTTTQEIAAGVRDIRQAIDELGRSGTIIAKPKTPQEFYHNARQFTLAGRTGEAIEAYQAFLEAQPDFVDVHQSFQALLLNTAGAERAREVYATLQTERRDNIVIKMMNFRLRPKEAYLQGLRELRTAHPDFAPAHLALLQHIAAEGMARLTTAEWRDAEAAYVRLQQLDRQGQFKEFFLDKEALQKVYDELRRFDAMVVSFGGERLAQPVRFYINQGRSAVSVSVSPNDLPPEDILYNVDTAEPLLSMGLTAIINPLTNKPAANEQVQLQLAPGKHTIYAKYIDAKGVASPLFTHEFDVWPFRIDITPEPAASPDGTRSAELAFLEYLNHSFTTFYYSVDAPTLDQRTTQTRVTLQGLRAGPHSVYVQASNESGNKTAVFNQSIQLY